VLCTTHCVAQSAEETIYGILEKTTRAGASAQITDTLNETYYITKSDVTDKLIADFVGKNIRVVITGVAERKEGDTSWYFNLKTVQKNEAKKETDSKTKTDTPLDDKGSDKKTTDEKK
jgi:hypothetical protein